MPYSGYMLYKTRDKNSGKTLHTTKPLLLTPKQGYVPPAQGKEWWQTTTTIWNVDELIRRRVRDWRRLLDETGHTGARAEVMRKDHDSVYTSTYSSFAAPLVEWIIMRYGGPVGSTVLDAFAGGPPRAVVSAMMGHPYTGFEIRQEQINENETVLKKLKLGDATYVLGDGTKMEGLATKFDFGLTCPPYYDLEVYSELETDISTLNTYADFNRAMRACAVAYRDRLVPGAFMCIVVGPFRDKRTGELIDFPAHTVENFRQAGFTYWQQIILSKNFASAAKRSTNAWKGLKLVPRHEFLQVFRVPQ